MAFTYDKEKYEFKKRGFKKASPLNPDLHEVTLSFWSEKYMLLITGQTNADYTGFDSDADPESFTVRIVPKDENKIWTEAVIGRLKIIPMNGTDNIDIKTPGMSLSVKLSDVDVVRETSVYIKRAVAAIAEADRIIRETFPGYCLTKTKIG